MECRRCRDPHTKWEGDADEEGFVAGGVLLSLPAQGMDWMVAKDHLCPDCYLDVLRWIDRGC